VTRITKPLPFADRLRNLRQSADLSQSALCRAAGMPLRTLADLEQGVNLDPRWSTVCKLADALGVSTEKLR
jgi:transcriptional regulator with XRE-family HTH domain